MEHVVQWQLSLGICGWAFALSVVSASSVGDPGSVASSQLSHSATVYTTVCPAEPQDASELYLDDDVDSCCTFAAFYLPNGLY